MAGRVELQVPGELDGERVDKAVAMLLGISRTQARVLVDDGVTIDGLMARPKDRVVTGALLSTPEPRVAVAMKPEDVPFGILHEDPHLIVVDKPAGVVVHPGSGRKSGTLAAGLLFRYPELEGVGDVDRWGLVHRLDRDTSGALIVARTDESYEELSKMIRQRDVKRTYTALSHGILGSPSGSIDAPIGRDPLRPTRRAVVATGKEARTHYEVDEYFDTDECSLLTVRLETGRTHQIRVHLAAIDHPVIGDKTYGRKTRTDSPRIFLHARSVKFSHPFTEETIESVAPLPSDLRRVLDSLTPRSAS